MWKRGRSEFIPFAITVIGIVFTDLLSGISLGLVVAVVFILWENFKIPYKFDIKHYEKGEPIVIAFSESVSFLNKASIQRTLNTVPDDSKIILDATATLSMHLDVKEIIEEFQISAVLRNIEVVLVGFGDTVGKEPVAQFEKVVLKQTVKSSVVRSIFKKK